MSDTQDATPTIEAPEGPFDIVETAIAEEAGAVATPPADGAQAAEETAAAPGDKPPEPPADAAAPEAEMPKSWKAVIAREQSLRAQADEIKRQQAALEQAGASTSKQYQQQVEAFDAEMKSDPLGTLARRYNLTLNDLAERALGGQPGPAESQRQTHGQISEDTQTLKKEVTELRNLIQGINAQRLVDHYRAGVDALLADEKYELLRARADGDAIMERAGDLARNGVALSQGELLDRLQAEYREELTSTVSHAAAVKALEAAGFTVSRKSNGDSGSSEAPQGQKAQPQTLTNGLNQSPPPRPARDYSLLSDDELIAEAIAAESGSG